MRWRLIALWSALLVLSSAAAADPRSDYLLHCGGCHLEGGQGMPPEVPDLTHDLDQFAATREGRAYLVQVPGASQAPLSDAALGEVMNWIFTTYYPNQNVRLYSEKEVSRYRKTPLIDPLRRRVQLLSGN